MTNLFKERPRGATVLLCAVQTALLATTAAAQPVPARSLSPSVLARSGDAYAQAGAAGGRHIRRWTVLAQSGDAHAEELRTGDKWRFGTALVEKQVQLKDGHLALLSFKDPGTGHEYVQGVSDLLAFTWNGQVMTGQNTLWVLDGVTTQRLKQGELLFALHVHTAGVAIVKSYLLYPRESLVQEWLQITNRSDQPAALSDPLSLTIQLLQQEAPSIDLTTLGGAQPVLKNWIMHTAPLPADSTTFETMANDRWAPIQVYQNRATKNGVFMGWDYTGKWRAVVGKMNGTPVSVSMGMEKYQRSLTPGESVELPKVFTGVFHGDLDEMGHQMLDYQYRYKWTYTRDAYFPGLEMLGYWAAGSLYYGSDEPLTTGGKFDPFSTYRKVFHMTDVLRAVGGDGYWRDYGWWDNMRNWNGPNFGETGRYLAQYGMYQTIYLPLPQSQWAKEHPDWLLSDGTLDETQPAVIDWERHLLEARQRQWGNFAWRVDGFAVGPDNSTGKQLLEDQAYRRLVMTFLDRHPGMGYHGCAAGGTDLNYDRLELAAVWQMTDGFKHEVRRAYNASYLFPPDKLENSPDSTFVETYDKATWRGFLTNRFSMSGETEDPAKLEGLRELFDLYHYMRKMGVVGRWVWVYHPRVTGDDPMRYFERLSGDYRRGVIIPNRPQKSPITIYPKGLLPTVAYQVSYQESPQTATRSGAEWMAQGISLSSVPDGELIYLNLPLHPGSAADRTPPTPPSHVTEQVATHMDSSGVDIRWQPGHDDNWISYYQLSRNGIPLAKVAKGTYYFDHALGADLAAHYAVATVDGSGNLSAPVSATAVSGPAAIVVDDADSALTYKGTGWEHRTGQWSVANGTESRTKTKDDALAYTFTGSRITWYGRMGRDKGIAAVYLDGQLDRLVNTYDADEMPNIALYSRTFPTLEQHTIRIVATGDQTVVAMGAGTDPSQSWIVVDGLEVDSTQPKIVSDIPYRGQGWQQGPPQESSKATAASQGSHSKVADDKAEYTFTGRGITWVGRRCSGCGMADVYVDGKLETSVDTYESPVHAGSLTEDEQRNVPVFTRQWPAPGRHTFKIVIRPDANLGATGHIVYLDALHIRP